MKGAKNEKKTIKNLGCVILAVAMFCSMGASVFAYNDAAYGSTDENVEYISPRAPEYAVIKNTTAYKGHECPSLTSTVITLLTPNDILQVAGYTVGADWIEVIILTPGHPFPGRHVWIYWDSYYVSVIQ